MFSPTDKTSYSGKITSGCSCLLRTLLEPQGKHWFSQVAWKGISVKLAVICSMPCSIMAEMQEMQVHLMALCLQCYTFSVVQTMFGLTQLQQCPQCSDLSWFSLKRRNDSTVWLAVVINICNAIPDWGSNPSLRETVSSELWCLIVFSSILSNLHMTTVLFFFFKAATYYFVNLQIL